MDYSSKFTGFKNSLNKIQSCINTLLLISLILLVSIQIILRYVFKSPLLGIEEMMIFPTIWLYLLGGASASLEEKHIECGMLDSMIKSPIKLQMTAVIKNLISIIVCIILCWLSFDFFSYSLKMWKLSGTLSIPMFFGESSFFISILLMAIYSIFELIKNVNKYCNMKEKEVIET
ncbi:TRAP transporter small permease [Clostridium magnum]|uniref:2,3-diketo-L-gulonate TRAP transporter small permease protein YiaM n=1 Tax=Clostridium magnum DSM 2767 TaxID=1121326 RepID=A0A162RFQ3_9CLOT|nr:TRAP transporter small permease [Clostridium magnum]KZL89834.1 2,3-diketo-L-gulonate TRAP transporter small permease protein YiaM [Clostridium magnum DSM 2767]SHI70022.1 TRAP-type C4-dicarboxylate transport system, small permease component [Clostridium magnum DSM 2767]